MKRFPLKYISITTPFSSNHHGIDLGWNRNQGGSSVPVYAADDGTVTSIKDHDKSKVSWGNYVKIKHSDGTYTLYAHLKEGVKVKVGQKLKQGDQIGNMGNTGFSKGNHLHYEVYVGGSSTSCRKNPLDYTYAYEDQVIHKDTASKIKYKPKDVTSNVPKEDEKDKQINQLNDKIKEQDNQILNLKSQISEKEAQIEELNNKLINSTCKHKLLYKCEKDGKYKLQLFENEVLYIESNN